MKREGPGGTSTPSIVPTLKGRPPVSNTYNMGSPIPGNNFVMEAHNKSNSFFSETGKVETKRSSAGSANESESSEDSSESDTSDDTSQSKAQNDDLSEKGNDKRKKKREESSSKEIKHKTTQNLKYTFEGAQFGDSEMQIRSIMKINDAKQNRKHAIKYILNFQQAVCVIFVSLFCVFVYSTRNTSNTTHIGTISIDEIKEIFPQDNAFWISIQTGVSEVTNFNKPSVIILLHKHSIHNFTELLHNITTYASCILNEDCSVEPIVIEGNDLNTHEMKKDYGIIIDYYSPLLNEKHIMVVKNMDDMSGSVAQAFHYICDEFSPLVRKSLIIFTIQVDKYKEKALEQAVDILNRKWDDVEPEKLEALITRVSSIVLQVK